MTKLESKIDRKYNCQQVRINNNNRAQIEYKVWFLVGFKTIQECKKIDMLNILEMVQMQMLDM